MNRPPLELTGEDHGMNPIADALHAEHGQMCARAGISPWDFCVALMNAAARILADSKDMPPAVAFERIDALGDVAKAAYQEHRHASSNTGRA